VNFKNNELLKEYLKREESHAIKGWDFSYIKNRWDGGEKTPWDYERVLLKYIKKTNRLLDMGTGGGEFLLTLKHPYSLTYVTEGYIPNLELCKRTLEPLGITVQPVHEDGILPYKSDMFDIIINRHELYNSEEVYRVLKNGGYFITQQVGGKNDYDLSQKLIDNFVPAYPNSDLEHMRKELEKLGFDILFEEESFTPIRFYDLGALVYFAKIIEWEFPKFSVDSCFKNLLRVRDELKEKSYIEGMEHRFILVAQKSDPRL